MLMNSSLSDAPPTKKPSISFSSCNLEQFAPFTEPPYRMRVASATAAETFSDSHLRISECTSWAWSKDNRCDYLMYPFPTSIFFTCWGVATLPVPIAHTGSYATTTLLQSWICSFNAANCRKTTCVVWPDSRSSNFSPQQKMTFSPALRATAVFLATT